MPSKKEAKPRHDDAPCDNLSEAKDHGASRATPSRACKRACQDVRSFVWAFVNFCNFALKILGPCLMCVAVGIVSFCTYTFFVHFLPVYGDVLGPSGQASLAAAGVFLEFNAIYNYYKCVRTDPGLPPEFDVAMREAERQGEELGETRKRKDKQCYRCSRLKPARCHHCSVCQRCVLKMDHHCPWVNNCVGHNNYRHFCLFLLFMALSALFVVLCLGHPFSQILFFRRSSRRISREGRDCIMDAFVLCAAVLVALCFLGCFHVYLVLTNQTTIEFQLNRVNSKEARKNGEFFRNPYNLGRSRNFQQVFGPNAFWSLLWLLPWRLPAARQPLGDGLTYPSIYMEG
eukprot:TRINITY_DN15816_c0_g1_i1.p1 TRINITY_DN15816_c0_g1~~TRINITY_DN15816_c0_g1_i1.p1  ORF type:complete len:344 (-),score=49.67 TRINITY_DN15816_c0_g1_i1:27-1058(-)